MFLDKVFLVGFMYFFNYLYSQCKYSIDLSGKDAMFFKNIYFQKIIYSKNAMINVQKGHFEINNINVIITYLL